MSAHRRHVAATTGDGRGPRRPTRRAAAAVAGVLLAAFSVIPTGVTAQEADPILCGTYDAVAAADGVRTAVFSPGFVVVEQADAGSPAAQALMDSVGTSASFAAYPHPGEAALSALGLAGLPRDIYPLIVEASFPTSPEAELDAGGVALRASASERSTSSSGQGGVANDDTSTGLTRARADITCADDGTLTAEAESIVEGLSFGAGALRIGRVRSVATVAVDPAGNAKSSSSLEASQISVGGVTVGLSDEGLVLGTSALPLPDNPLAEVLAEAGIELDYVAASPEDDGTGISAPTLRVQVTRDAVGTGATVVSFTFGRAFASASAEPPSGNGAVVGGDDDVLLPSSSDPFEPLPSATPPSGAHGSASAPTAPISTEQQGSFIPPGFSAGSVYVVMAIAAAVLLGSSWLIRRLGVRLQWT